MFRVSVFKVYGVQGFWCFRVRAFKGQGVYGLEYLRVGCLWMRVFKDKGV